MSLGYIIGIVIGFLLILFLGFLSIKTLIWVYSKYLLLRANIEFFYSYLMDFSLSLKQKREYFLKISKSTILTDDPLVKSFFEMVDITGEEIDERRKEILDITESMLKELGDEEMLSDFQNLRLLNEIEEERNNKKGNKGDEGKVGLSGKKEG